MRVIVTGGAGYIGSHTAKALAAAGHEPIVVDDLRAGHRSFVRWGPFVEGDIGNAEVVAQVLVTHRPDAIIHFAGSAYVGESMEQPHKYFRNNAINSLALLEQVVDRGPMPFVFSSSCATYGIPDCVPITEEAPQVPVNPYGESKLMVERALRWYGERRDLPWMALRYFNAAGADSDGELGELHDPETHLVPRVIAAALGTIESVGIYGRDHPTSDGTAVRDYIHVADLAAAHVLAIEQLAAGGASCALNLGTGVGHSVLEVVEAVARISGRRVPTTDEPRRAGDPAVLVAAATAAATRLGWAPRHSDLDTIVETALRWELGRS